MLNDVSFVDAQRGWAIGIKGLILATADGGKTWVKQVGGSNKPMLTEVHFADQQHGSAVGIEGTILATADGGKTWTTQSSGMTEGFEDVYFIDAQRGWAVGMGGVIVATADGGKTWTAQVSGTTALLISVHFSDAMHGWVVGHLGTVLSTEDGGTNWRAQTSGTQAALGGVVFTDVLHGYAVGEAGTIVATADGGKTWTSQRSGTSAGLLGLAFADAQHGWSVGYEGTIVATADAGKTWTTQDSGIQQFLVSVSFTDVHHGWAVGQQGIIVATADGGKSWKLQLSGTAMNLTSVHFVDSHHGWAVGQSDTRLVATWTGDAPSLAEFNSIERGPRVQLSWKARDEHPETVTCVAVEFRQSPTAAWRTMDVSKVTATGLDWSPDAPEYQILPGISLFYRVTLRDNTGLTYTHELPEGYTYRPLWNRQPFWVKAGICAAGAIATYLVACGFLLVVYPVGMVRLWSALSRALIEPLDPSRSARSIVRWALALTGLPAFATMRRVRIAWVRSFRNGRSRLEDLGESVRDEYLRHPEVLDSWVVQYRELAGRVFEDRFTVKARLDNTLDTKGWVPLPLWVIDKTENDPSPELLRERLRPVFERDSIRLLIHGEGGTGKTTLACLLAAWALEPAGESGLTPHAMLPILIEHELPAGLDPLRDAIRSALLDLVGQGTTVSDDLLDQLLRLRRLLVIVDHLSEMSQETRATIRMNRNTLPINALVITSRASEELDGSVTDRIETLKIDGNHLTRFLDAYLSQRGKRDLFTDPEYEEARRRLANMLGRTDRSIPVLFPKLYADRLIADREGADGVAQPLSVPELMSYYVVEQNRNVAEPDHLSDDVVDQWRSCGGVGMRPDRIPPSVRRTERHPVDSAVPVRAGSRSGLPGRSAPHPAARTDRARPVRVRHAGRIPRGPGPRRDDRLGLRAMAELPRRRR